MKSISEFTKDDLRSFIKDFEEDGYDEFECLCAYCNRCSDREDKPDDCQPEADNEDCFDAYKEMILCSRLDNDFI